MVSFAELVMSYIVQDYRAFKLHRIPGNCATPLGSSFLSSGNATFYDPVGVT